MRVISAKASICNWFASKKVLSDIGAYEANTSPERRR